MKGSHLPKFLIIILFVFLTCQKDEPVTRAYPRINTLAVNNITEKGVVFNAEIYDASDKEIIDHGFIWGYSSNLAYNGSERFSIGSKTGEGLFSKEITTTLEAGKTYYVKAYVKTTQYTVYGKVVEFFSLGSEAPLISGFEPDSAGWGDTITVYGKNFSWLSYSNKVYFGDKPGIVTSSSDTLIKVKVPVEAGSADNFISVELAGNINHFTADTLKLLVPVFNDFYPKMATWGDTVTIFGDYLNYCNENSFSFDHYQAKATYISKTQCKIVVPDLLNSSYSRISLLVNKNKYFAPVEFRLHPPVIKSFYPEAVYAGTNVTLTGQYLKMYHTLVKIGNEEFSPGFINDSVIKFSMPYFEKPGKYVISVRVLSQKNSEEKTINYLVPQITKIEPLTAAYGDTITIYGNYFDDVSNNNSVYFGSSIPVQPFYSENNVLKVAVPLYLFDSVFNVSVKSQIGSSLFPTNFTLKKPKILSYEPYEITTGCVIKITGENLSPDINNPHMFRCENIQGKIISASKTSIEFEVSSVFAGASTLYFYSAPFSSFELAKVNCVSPFKKIISEFPTTAYAFSGAINNIGYIGSNGTDIYEFNPAIKSWSHKLNFNYHSFHSYFIINDRIYIIGGTEGYNFGSLLNYLSPDVFEYNTTLNTIKDKQDFPGEKRIGSFAFSIHNKGYYGGGENNNNLLINDFWEYDFASDTWKRKADFTGGGCTGAASFVINGFGYVIKGKELWRYDPQTDAWTKKENFPGTSRYFSNTFVLDNKGYLVGGCSNIYYYNADPGDRYDDIWMYDPDNETWIQKSKFPGLPFASGVSFVINNKSYIGSGLDQVWGKDDFFEYDPTQDN